MPEEVKPILVRFPPEMRQRIEKEAAADNRSMSNLIILVLKKFFRAVDEKRTSRES